MPANPHHLPFKGKHIAQWGVTEFGIAGIGSNAAYDGILNGYDHWKKKRATRYPTTKTHVFKNAKESKQT